MNRLLTFSFAILSTSGWLCAQDTDHARTAAELAHVFDRPQGTPIGAEQKQRLAAFLETHKHEDLGDLGYASALQRFLERDVDGAVTELDRFLATHHTVANAEHRTMLGRVYLNAVSQEGRKPEPDLAKLAQWSERMTEFYDDASMLARISSAVARGLKDSTSFRLGVAKGVLASALSDADKESVLRSLFETAGAATAGNAAGRPNEAGGLARARAVPRESAGTSDGEVVTAFEVLRTLNADRFDLTSLRGKVVVLDFFATWCPPCRASVPGMVDLQKQAGDDLQVVGVTRFYGRGMDFSTAGATLPHGGKSVKDLDENAEVAINEAFIGAFELNYPLVFTTADVTSKQFGVTGIPTAFVLGKDGKLIGKVVGGGEAAHAKLLELIATARKG